jgi:hypothetical protein
MERTTGTGFWRNRFRASGMSIRWPALLTALLLLRAAAFAGSPENPVLTQPSRHEALFKIYGWAESGFTANPASPNDHQNFGRLFDDRSNEPLLNQAAITLERTLSATASDFSWGLKLQFIYGSDSRFIHSLGLFDRITDDILQPDISEAYLNLHLPVLTSGGLDLKLGKFVTLEGAETIDPRTNVFYSHSYIFNFGIPFNHTGALATLHASKAVDLYAGITRGVNTSLEDNNDSVAFDGGVGLNLLDGGFTLLATTHIGPETPDNNHDYRYLNDITIVARPTKQLTLITDLNYIYDAAADATGYGMAQYLTYTFNDLISIGVRGEIWRDADNFYVAQFADNDDLVDSLRGGNVTLDPRTVTGGDTTYGAITLGLTIKPPAPKPLTGCLIRPEVRYDHSLNGTHPFNDSTDRDQFTAGVDVIFSF